MLVLLLPLLSFIIIFFFSNYLGRNGVLLYSIFNLSIVNLLCLLLFLLLLVNNYSIYISLCSWISFLQFDVTWLFRLDILSISMAYIVTLISMFVHIYSVDYMYADPNRSLFLGYLSLFTFFMILLVCSGNMFLFFISWEGVGICSYLLINFWNSRIIATQSAVKAVLVNRISDLFLLVGLIQLSIIYSTVDFTVIELYASFTGISSIVLSYSYFNTLKVCSLLLFMGVVGKSAQLLLHVWLPDAMEGPTPVSALLHAATMVTAGIFLVLRFSYIFEYNFYLLQFMGICGVLTIIVSGCIGLFQYDIKKVIAYSTCSQLGYMLIVCSASVYYISLYHFTIHAFFKALLFLLAGCIIHSIYDEQDMRKYGGLMKIYPLSYIFFIIGNSALVAEPFLSGYYSKELIIFSLNDTYVNSYSYIYWLSVYGAILTLLYSSRSIWLVFFSYFRGFINNISNVYELSYITLYPLSILTFFSICGGYLYSSIFRDGSLFGIFYVNISHTLSYHYIYDFLKLEHNYLILISNFIFIILFLFYGNINIWISGIRLYRIRCFFVNKWFFDYLYNRVFSNKGLIAGENVFYYVLDKGYIELLGPFGIYNFIYNKYKFIATMKTYTIYNDVVYIFMYIILFIMILLFINAEAVSSVSPTYLL